ncbi:MAG: hypothetical protein ABIK92_00780 [Pseudomonadota bacterium]
MKMKSLVIIVSLFVSSLFFSACNNQDQAKEPESMVTAQDVKKESKEALNTVVAYTEQKKEAYQKQIDADLKAYDQKIDKLKAGAMELKDDARDEYNHQIAILEKKKKSASEKFNELKSASGETWDDVKSGMDKAVDELRDDYDKVIARFKNS